MSRARLAVPAVADRLERPVRRSAAPAVHPARLAPAARSPEARPRLAARARRRAGARADPPLPRQGAVPARSTPARSTAASARAATRSASTPRRSRRSSSRSTTSAGSRRSTYIALAPRARGHRHLRRRRVPAARRADHADRRDAARRSPHIRRIRFATKGPAVMPQKILTDDAWIDALTARRRARAASCTRRSCSTPTSTTRTRSPAITKARDGQAVRARHHRAQPERCCSAASTTRVETMTLLVKRLGHVNVHPYYVYVHDLVKGVEDLRTTLQTGARHREARARRRPPASTRRRSSSTRPAAAASATRTRTSTTTARPASRCSPRPAVKPGRVLLLLRSDRSRCRPRARRAGPTRPSTRR